MWRGFSTNFSTKTRSSPKLDFASAVRGQEAFANLLGRTGDAHAFAAAAGAGLDHHGIADIAGDANGLLRALDDAEIAGHRRDARGGRRLLALDLIAHGANCFDIRADEDEVVRLERLGEGRVLGEEAIAWMDRFRFGFLGRGDDLIHHKVGLRGGRGADENGFVGHLDMDGVAIRLGIDRDRLDPHPFRGLDHAAGDFATVGDEDFFEHGRHPMRAGAYCIVTAVVTVGGGGFNAAYVS